MPTNYRTIPCFLSGFNVITGYICPINKNALIKQIALANETSNVGRVDVKWIDKNLAGLGTSLSQNLFQYPVVISGGVSGYSTAPLLQEFISIRSGDYITFRTTTTGINAILTILEQDII